MLKTSIIGIVFLLLMSSFVLAAWPITDDTGIASGTTTRSYTTLSGFNFTLVNASANVVLNVTLLPGDTAPWICVINSSYKSIGHFATTNGSAKITLPNTAGNYYIVAGNDGASYTEAYIVNSTWPKTMTATKWLQDVEFVAGNCAVGNTMTFSASSTAYIQGIRSITTTNSGQLTTCNYGGSGGWAVTDSCNITTANNLNNTGNRYNVNFTGSIVDKINGSISNSWKIWARQGAKVWVTQGGKI